MVLVGVNLTSCSTSNLSRIVALGSLFHLAERDFEIGEYVIPKGAKVLADTRSLMYDEQVNEWCFIGKVQKKPN